MYRKYAKDSYERKKEYCDTCLDEIVASAPCRNTGCKSIGGTGVVQATFGDQLFYAEKQLTFPPNNCEVCRVAKEVFKKRQEVRPTCRLCKKSFRVTYGVMIMILKNEEKCEVPKECLRCRGLMPDERRRMERERELDDLGRKRRGDVAKILAGDKQELAREKARRIAAGEEKVREFLRLLNQKSKLTKRDVRSVLREAASDKTLLKILSDPKEIGYRKIHDALAHVTGGKGKMTDKEFAALPKAFETILKDHADAMGMFQKAPAHRAPGMSPVNQHYEVLSTAALKADEFKTKSNKSLRIYSTDRVDFGIRFARDHSQPKRYGTIEADVLIHRDQGLLGLSEKTIAIDAKYTKGKEYDIISEKHLKEVRRQLEGVRNNLQNGNLSEFHYVTNKVFGEDFKKEVEKTNLQLVRDYVERHNQNFRSEHEVKELAYLTAQEKAAMPSGKVEPGKLGDLKEYSQVVRDFADKYHIEQIEICEHVKYPGT